MNVCVFLGEALDQRESSSLLAAYRAAGGLRQGVVEEDGMRGRRHERKEGEGVLEG